MFSLANFHAFTFSACLVLLLEELLLMESQNRWENVFFTISYLQKKFKSCFAIIVKWDAFLHSNSYHVHTDKSMNKNTQYVRSRKIFIVCMQIKLQWWNLKKWVFGSFAALNLKEIPYDIKPVSLIKAGGEQHSNEFREVNPMEQVPALHIDGNTLVESLNILHYLEETRPQRPLMPHDVVKRAKVKYVKVVDDGKKL